MNGTIEIPFAIGETVWHASIESEPEMVTCEDCAGTAKITMVKGNGEEVTLECKSCYPGGFEPSRGTVKKPRWVAAPRQVTLRSVEVQGNEFTYYDTDDRYGWRHVYRVDNLFRDEAACQAKCDELAAEHTKEDIERRIRNISSDREDMAFSVHYWQRQIKDLEKKLELARARLQVSQAKKPRKPAKS